MGMFIEELAHYKNLKRLAILISKPCIWYITLALMETEDRAMNITALISKLNSNYRTISKCIDYMRKLQIIEEVQIGRLRLVRLLDNALTHTMINILKEIKESNRLLLSE